MLRKKYILGILLAIFMLCAVVSAVDDVSAAKYKVIDKGTKYYDNDVKGDKNVKSVWKTYSNGKKIVIYWKGYNNFGKKEYKLVTNSKITVTKVSKTKFKITDISYRTKYVPYDKDTYYVKSKLSLKSYYSKTYKPALRSPYG